MTASRLKHCLLKTILRVSALALVLIASAPMARARDHHCGGGGNNGAPEIDPGLAAGGILLLVGGTLVLTGRRRPATN
jgi:hypothetical protein